MDRLVGVFDPRGAGAGNGNVGQGEEQQPIANPKPTGSPDRQGGDWIGHGELDAAATRRLFSLLTDATSPLEVDFPRASRLGAFLVEGGGDGTTAATVGTAGAWTDCVGAASAVITLGDSIDPSSGRVPKIS